MTVATQGARGRAESLGVDVGDFESKDVAVAWGKLRRDESGARHPLTSHMLDVAACFMALTRVAGFERAICRAAGIPEPLPELLRWRLSAMAYLHDLGKANAGFQAKQFAVRQAAWPAPCGHVNEALACLDLDAEAGRLLHEYLPVRQLLGWGSESVVLNFLLASVSHHGRPATQEFTLDPAIWRDAGSSPAMAYSPAVALRNMGAHLIQSLTPAFQSGGPPLPDRPELLHLFAGMVQLADWLGSDTRHFPFDVDRPDPDDTWLRADRAVRAIGLNGELVHQALRRRPPEFQSAFGVGSPRPIQSRMGVLDDCQLQILESDTGSGKTEAALWHFLALRLRGQVDGLYFALPTRVAASQLYRRVCQMVEQVWLDPVERPVVVRALAGYEAVNGTELLARLPDFTVLWPDSPTDAQAHLRWSAESSKRFLAASIAIGTVDQVLLSGLMVRHAHLRQAALSRHLLVIDEVHASDDYMTRLTEHMLRAHLGLGGRALLLSATLGSTARERYQALGTGRPVRLPSLDEALRVPYPALTGRSTEAVEGSGRVRSIAWTLNESIADPSAIAAMAISAAREGAKVLVVRNTVADAVAVFDQIEATGHGSLLMHLGGVPTLHHGRFSRSDRPRLDERVEALVGRVRDDGGVILIGTQTLEQSLDIDADWLITDLCPMDVLLQRLGRLHRHERAAQERPPAFRSPCAVVLMPAGGDLSPLLRRPRHGLGRRRDGGGVYVDLRVLECTRRLVADRPTIIIPRDNRELVERSTHPQSWAAQVDLNREDWAVHAQSVDGDALGRQTVAELHRLNYELRFLDLECDRWLTFPSTDQSVATRLGAADLLITFDPPPTGPFGTPVVQLSVRPDQVRDVDLSNLQAEDVQPTESGFRFSLGPHHFEYTRRGVLSIRQ